MILSDTIKLKYKIDTKGRNTVEMAKLLKEYRVSGFLISVNDRTITMRVPREDIKMNRKIKEWLRMKIKRKVEMNLPQLIEWAWDNDIRNKGFESERTSRAYFDYDGYLSCTRAMEPTDTFTVEVEECVTEDTVIDEMLLVYDNGVTHIAENKNLSFISKGNLKSAYYMNDDLRLILIWRDGKLVE